MSICNKCNKAVSAADRKACSKCSSTYHYQCLGISTENFSKESKAHKASWKCKKCKPVDKRADTNDNPSTPTTSSSNLLPRDSSPADSFDELKMYIDKKFDDSLSKLLSDIRLDLNTESKNTRSKLSELTEGVNFLSTQYDQLNVLLESKIKIIDELQVENDELRNQVFGLNVRLNQIEQQSRDNNVEIQCVPESKTENLKIIIQKFADVIGCKLADHEMINYHRVAKLNPDTKRPRSIIVKLPSPLVRDRILAGVKTFNKAHQGDKLNSSHLGVAGDKTQVYVCEHLSPANKQLHAAARKAARDMKYRFVWVRNGRIYMRKDENSKSTVIRDENHLKTIN